MEKPWRSRYVSRISRSVSRSDDNRKRSFPYIAVDTDKENPADTQPRTPPIRAMRVWYPLATSRTNPAASHLDAQKMEGVEKLKERVRTISQSYNALADALEKANASSRSSPDISK